MSAELVVVGMWARCWGCTDCFVCEFLDDVTSDVIVETIP